MPKRVFIGSLTILLLAQVNVKPAEPPKLAARIPGDAVAAVFIKDLPELARGKAWMSSLSRVFVGEVAIALVEIPKKEETLKLLVVGEVDSEKLGDFLNTRLLPMLRRNLGKVEFESSNDGTDIVVSDSPTAFYTVKDRLFWFSLDEECVADLSSEPLPIRESLCSNSLFVKLLQRTSPTSRAVYYANVKKIYDALEEKIPEETRRVLKSIGILDVAAIGGGDEVIEGAGLGSLSLIVSGKPGGFLALAAQAAAEPTTARYVPGDYSLYARLRFSSFSRAWQQIRATLREIAGNEAGQGIEDFLEGFREATGSSFEQDLLGSLGGELAVAVAVPEKLRIPDSVALLEVKDRAKVEEIIAKLLPGPAGETHKYEEVTIRTARLGPLLAGYAFVDEYLVLGTDVSVVKAVVDTMKTGASLRANPAFRSAFTRLAEGGHILYLDIGSALPLYLTVINHFVTRWSEEGLRLEPPTWEVIGKLLMSPLLTDVVAALTISGDEESVTVRGYSTVSATYNQMWASSVMAGMMMPALTSAKVSARRAACLNNLKQLALAEHMYAADHDGKFSENLSDLYPEYVTSLDVFICPSAGPIVIPGKEDIDSLSSYVLRKSLTESSPGNEVLIYEKLENHEWEGGNAAFVDGHVEWLDASQLESIMEAAEAR